MGENVIEERRRSEVEDVKKDNAKLKSELADVKNELAGTKKEVEMLRASIETSSPLLQEIHSVKAEMKGLAEKISEQNESLKIIAKDQGRRLGDLEKRDAFCAQHLEGMKEMKAESKRYKEETDRRLAEIEKTNFTVARNEKYVEELKGRVDALEKAPANKWDKLQWLFIAGIVTAIVGYMMSQVL